MKKITAVIPTLLKDIYILNQLIDSLLKDESVEEVILINNSQKEYNLNKPKLRIISMEKNLFVNPSWNLGVEQAKTEYVTLVNDDIKIPNGLCSNILDKMDDSIGIIGMDTDFVINTRDNNNNIIIDITKENISLEKNIILKPIIFSSVNYGIMMFFKKENYTPIPEDLKIFFGDDWIFNKAAKAGKINVVCSAQKIFHCGSLSSGAFYEWRKKEKKFYKKYIIPKWKRMFYFYEINNHFVVYFLGLNFSLNKNKIHIITDIFIRK